MTERMPIVIACALAAIACQDRTTTVQPPEVIVRVTTTDEVLQQMDGLRVTIATQEDGSAWKVAKSTDIKEADLAWPVELPVVREASVPVHKRFEIVVEAMHAQVPFVQARAVVTWFDKGVRILNLELQMCADKSLGPLCDNDPGCHGASCCHGTDCKTCVNGVQCSSAAEIDGIKLLSFDPNKSRPNGVLSPDAGSDAAMAMATSACSSNHGGCDSLVTCKDVADTAVCGACPSGYEDSGGTGHKCVDIDECNAQTYDCKAHSKCVNTVGGYDCPCDATYNGEGHKQCGRNVLCNATGSNCDGHATCSSLSGERFCVCKTGYTGDGQTCADIRTCATNNGGCSMNPMATCNEVIGGPNTCSCPAGYKTSDHGVTCTDVNECTGTNTCISDYPCLNRTPFFTCRGQFQDWAPTYSGTGLVVNGDGTVTDPQSGLVWQRILPATSGGVSKYTNCSGQFINPGDTCTLVEAMAYCQALSLAGAGWRVPTKAELESIVDYGHSSPAIDPTAFPNTPAENFWTSSPFVVTPGNGWSISFDNGSSSGSSDTSYAYRVRCVH